MDELSLSRIELAKTAITPLSMISHEWIVLGETYTPPEGQLPCPKNC